MAKKNWFLEMLALVLVFGLSMSACEFDIDSGIAADTEYATKSGFETYFIYANRSSYTLKFEIESGMGWTPAEFTLLPGGRQIVGNKESLTGISYTPPNNPVDYNTDRNIISNTVISTITYFDR